ncbi:DnaJ-domain-containing protein [Neurospora crassa]|nr:DnaJ-domain-containing protein [Neurospora crassa]
MVCQRSLGYLSFPYTVGRRAAPADSAKRRFVSQRKAFVHRRAYRDIRRQSPGHRHIKSTRTDLARSTSLQLLSNNTHGSLASKGRRFLSHLFRYTGKSVANMVPPKITDFDYYATLGVSPYADKKAIQKAYHQLARERHPDRNGNSAEATANFQKLMNAYELLTDAPRRTEYDFNAEQEYIRMQGRLVVLQNDLRNKSPDAVAADAELITSWIIMTELAQDMGSLVRELKTIPDGHWEKREQQHQAEVAELRESIVSQGESLKIRFQHMQKLSTELAQERKKAHDAQTRYASLVEACRHQLTTYIDESTESAEGSETEPTTSEGSGGESTEETKQDTPMFWPA